MKRVDKGIDEWAEREGPGVSICSFIAVEEDRKENNVDDVREFDRSRHASVSGGVGWGHRCMASGWIDEWPGWDRYKSLVYIVQSTYCTYRACGCYASPRLSRPSYVAPDIRQSMLYLEALSLSSS
jgi:hypothetical protein